MISQPSTTPEVYKPTGAGDGDAYKLLFDESIRTLELLDRRADSFRTAYVTVLAFVGSGTAFLAGNVLTRFERDGTLRVLALSATVCFFGGLAVAIFDLLPRRRHLGIDTAPLAKYVDTFPGAYNVTLARLSQQNSAIAANLRRFLTRLSLRFAIFLALCFCSLLLWVVLAWVGQVEPAA